ncbi:hypothetical protein [Candidatus Contendibacter odensensis]|uniref:Uncharacterized protein n=1 Tax=Candidatus Contendobacter odensis Run_B_J11 TaxID=1400861 RepID=A0A7U7GEV5_9GAMM|nr:hypothetical protein [Candidatus Contendobacter odensis]CDH46974.1 putative Predicted protein [Candidatus Contendobacter odensis Run_B_J11]
MWIFLNDAFLSIVEDKNNPDFLLVRGRIKGDIEQVFPDYLAIEGEGTDYRFRALVERDIVAEALYHAACNVDYGNFKSSVQERERHDKYMKVWEVMANWQSQAESRERATEKAAKLAAKSAEKPLKPASKRVKTSG